MLSEWRIIVQCSFSSHLLSVHNIFDAFLSAPVTISSLTLQLTGGQGHDNYVKVSALYGIKFITIYLAAWVFCWACACQCALASWERPWYDSLRRPIRPPSGFHTPDVVRWMINITFPLVAITSTSGDYDPGHQFYITTQNIWPSYRPRSQKTHKCNIRTNKTHSNRLGFRHGAADISKLMQRPSTRTCLVDDGLSELRPRNISNRAIAGSHETGGSHSRYLGERARSTWT